MWEGIWMKRGISLKCVAAIFLLFLPALAFVVGAYSIIVENKGLELSVVQID
jgi:hypothetical protein